MSVPEPAFDRLWFDAGEVFAGTPVSHRELFAGRQDQIRTMMEVVSQRGAHGIIYGDRGVGKSSIANVFSALLAERGVDAVFPRTNCDVADTYSTLWRKILQDATLKIPRAGLGFGAIDGSENQRLLDALPFEIRPDDVRRALATLSQNCVLIIGIDEFDRLSDKSVTALMADTIKSLSDNAVPVTLFLIGVGDSVDELIVGHESIERALVQIPMPLMSVQELEQTVLRGLAQLDNMTIEPDSLAEIVSLSQGLPYITRMLALNSARAALHERRMNIGYLDLGEGIKRSLDKWQQSIVSGYYDATKSPQPDHLYREVLLGCALAERDEKGFFTAAAVRVPLRIVSERPELDIPNFSRHLKEFCEPRRASILTRVGETRRFRFCFTKPLMRPYVLMRSKADELLTNEMLQRLF